MLRKSAAGSFGLGFAERGGGIIISEVTAHSGADEAGLEAGVRPVRLECGHGPTYDADAMTLADIARVLRERDAVTLCVASLAEADLEPRALPATPTVDLYRDQCPEE